MANMKNSRERLYGNLIDRLTFDLSESQPIKPLHRFYTKKEHCQYNMHYGLELGILLRGRMPRYFGNYKLDIGPGEVWLCGMWEPHGYLINRLPCECVLLIIYPPVLARTHFEEAADISWLAPFEALPYRRPQVPKHLKRKMLELGQSFKSWAINGANTDRDKISMRLKLLEALLMIQEQWQLTTAWTPPNPEATSRLDKALSYAFKSRQFLSTQAMAKACGMSRNSFSALFRQMMNVSFSEFALRYRISSASQELLNSHRPIKAIASEWGFTDISHMYRCFKKYFGCTPAQYRKRTVPQAAM